MFSKEKKNKGFTLVELIIVVAILAILVGLLAPQYTKYVEKSRKTADLNNLNSLVNAIKVAAADPDYNLGSKTEPKTRYRIIIGVIYTETVHGVEIQRFEGDEDDQVVKALKEYSGLDFRTSINQTYLSSNFINETMKIKSHKWGVAEEKNSDPNHYFWATNSGIGAEVVLDNSTGAITVNYTDNVVNYLDHGTIDPQ